MAVINHIKFFAAQSTVDAATAVTSVNNQVIAQIAANGQQATQQYPGNSGVSSATVTSSPEVNVYAAYALLQYVG
jgi:hypothetical protein